MKKFDNSYLEMASVWARNSYCKRRQVGALLVKDRMIISDGYNGTPSGFENVCEDETGATKPPRIITATIHLSSTSCPMGGLFSFLLAINNPFIAAGILEKVLNIFGI